MSPQRNANETKSDEKGSDIEMCSIDMGYLIRFTFIAYLAELEETCHPFANKYWSLSGKINKWTDSFKVVSPIDDGDGDENTKTYVEIHFMNLIQLF